MTFTRVILLYFCVTSCTGYYRSNSQNHDYGRRRWNYSTENTTRATESPGSTRSLNNQVKIALYYETLCPASIQYLNDILRPVVEKLGPYLDIHLVPYGHALTRIINKRFKFKCQHGPPECYGNKLHGCAIDSIQNSTKSTLFVACLMAHTEYREGIGHDYTSALTTCAYKMNVSSDSIRRCMNSRRGAVLQKRFGDETNRLPQLEYVPYVLINDIENFQNEDLATLICRILNSEPTVCPRPRESYVTR